VTVLAQRGELLIRRMRDDAADYDLMVEWRNRPHVREWWDPDEPDLRFEGAVVEYRPYTDDESPSTACIIEFANRPIGYMQFYPWEPYEEEGRALDLLPNAGAWGLDMFLGEADLIGQGLGSAAVDALSEYLFEAQGASSVRLVAAIDNVRALHAYERAKFRRAIRVLDTDTRGGERVESWLMVRERAR
jgi:aminoglycoside 6'-N-acetyltransferase